VIPDSVALLPHGRAQLLDRYQLIGEIATGGMATVFLARIAGVAGFQRFVAIKQLHPHLSRRPEFVEMFLDEARLAASIHHQNVVPILEIGTSEGGYYVVMEYVEGVTLARLLRDGGGEVSRRVVLRMIIDVLSGLDAAHELTDNAGMLLGVVHRDCSPQNILVGLDGCTRLTDFGIARASQRLATTRDGSMKGKLAYMAPEQTQAEDVDRRADVFSVGVVLWEGLAQRRLFKRRSDAEVLRALLTEPIPLLDEVEPGMPPALVACVARALARDPARRFQTAAALADAIEQAEAEAGPEGIATVREVEAYMRRHFGGAFTFRRDEVRNYLAGTPSTGGFVFTFRRP
jgi:serine/threonine-protein kinase